MSSLVRCLFIIAKGR